MLVLSRKRSGQIVIGTAIRVTVLKIEGSQVRLGIEAPEDLVILRAELVDDAERGSRKDVPTPHPGVRPGKG